RSHDPLILYTADGSPTEQVLDLARRCFLHAPQETRRAAIEHALQAVDRMEGATAEDKLSLRVRIVSLDPSLRIDPLTVGPGPALEIAARALVWMSAPPMVAFLAAAVGLAKTHSDVARAIIATIGSFAGLTGAGLGALHVVRSKRQ